ncbi:DUF4396 domain-containing protein [Morganella morganii subsp. sibonii]
MELAWPVNALYFSVIALIFYFWFGRSKLNSNDNPALKSCSMKMSNMDMHSGYINTPPGNNKIHWKSMFKIGTHCGSGCTIADIIGEVFVMFIPIYILGSAVYGSWIFDFILALVIGIYFQYIPGRNMGLSRSDALKKAIQADTLSVISWQVGMYIWMGLVFFVFFSPSIDRTSAVYWFMMQISMIFGFFTAYPMNLILVRKGIKHIM